MDSYNFFLFLKLFSLFSTFPPTLPRALRVTPLFRGTQIEKIAVKKGRNGCISPNFDDDDDDDDGVVPRALSFCIFLRPATHRDPL
jgi:hypothetical protein